MHSALHFFNCYKEITTSWLENSNYIVCLSVKDEFELNKLLDLVKSKGIKHYAFYEPDLGDRLTAICLEPTPESRKITSSIPLAGKEVTNV